MMRLSSLAKNSFWMVVSRFGVQALAIVFTVLIARRLGTTGFGEYAFVAALLYVFNAITTFGTDMLLIREIAGGSDLSRWPPALLTQLLLSAIFIVAVWIAAPLLPRQGPAAIESLRIYSFALIPLAFFTVFTTILRGLQRLELYTLLNLGVAALQALLIWLFMQSQSNVVSLAILLLVVQITAAAFAAALVSRTLPGLWTHWKLRGFSAVWPLVRVAAPIALLTVLGMLYQKLTITMLSTMRGPADTGIFSAAVRAVEASKGIHLAAFAALYPAMAQGVRRAKLDHSSRAALHVTSLDSKYFALLLVGAASAACVLAVFAKPIIFILYGSGFLSAVPILQIVSWTLLPFAISGFLSLVMMAEGGERSIVRIMLVSLLALLALNLWWIPLQGLAGAARAFLVAECLQAGLMLAARRGRVLESRHRYGFSELS